MQPFVIVRALHASWCAAGLGVDDIGITELPDIGYPYTNTSCNNAKMQLDVFFNCKTFLNIIVYACDEQSSWDLHRNRMDVKCMLDDNGS